MVVILCRMRHRIDLPGSMRNMISLLRDIFGYLLRLLWLMIQPKAVLAVRLMAVESQLVLCVDAVNRKKAPKPRFSQAFRLLWVLIMKLVDDWEQLARLMKPATVVKWHRERFRRYWTELSRPTRDPGRPKIDGEIRELIRRMALENDWGAPRIHGELEKLGFTVSEATISRYMPQRPAHPDVVRRWLAFLRNHSDGIAAMDFWVPTASLRVEKHSPSIRRRDI